MVPWAQLAVAVVQIAVIAFVIAALIAEVKK